MFFISHRQKHYPIITKVTHFNLSSDRIYLDSYEHEPFVLIFNCQKKKKSKSHQKRSNSNEEEMELLQHAEFKEAFQEFDKVTNKHCFSTSSHQSSKSSLLSQLFLQIFQSLLSER